MDHSGKSVSSVQYSGTLRAETAKSKSRGLEWVLSDECTR
jgi:hypothetical protein